MERIISKILIMFIIPTGVVFGHKPIANPGNAGSAATAVEIADPDVSQVIYHAVSAQNPGLWLSLKGRPGFPLYVSIGVPAIDRLADYRPTLAVFGPGLPPVSAPFEIPAGAGGVVLPSDSAKPRFFHEPVTGTDSWILVERTITLPDTGRYYVVAYPPDGTPGKLWVAVGTKERFGLGDIVKLPGWRRQVRAFHEVK